MRYLVLLLLTACSQQHLSIGGARRMSDAGTSAREIDAALGSDEPPSTDPTTFPLPDAELDVDAAVHVGDSGSISVLFRAFGRDGVSKLHGNCGGACTDVSVRVSGGLPPYRVRWYDGSEGLSHKFCDGAVSPDAAQRASMVRVTDAQGQSVQAPLDLHLSPCMTDDALWQVISNWTLCVAPAAVRASCGTGQTSGDWYDVNPPPDYPIDVSVSLSGATDTSATLFTAKGPCMHPLTRLDAGTWPADPKLGIYHLYVERYLRVGTLDGGLPPDALQVDNLTACMLL